MSSRAVASIYSLGASLLVLMASAGCGGSSAAPVDSVETDLESLSEPSAESSTASEESFDEQAILIDAPTLKKQMDKESKLRVLDTRRLDEYRAGHIPGAVHVDVSAWRAKSLSEGGLKDVEFWSKTVGDLGIQRDSRVVIYGETGPNAGRVWWTLCYLGLTDVHVMNGTWRQWERKYYPVDLKLPQVVAVNFEPSFQSHMLMETATMKESVTSSNPGFILVDTRSYGEYTGQDRQGERGGHLPGAVHLEWSEVLDDAGRVRPREELQDLFRERGIDIERTVVTHCQTGGRSSVVALALSAAGCKHVKNYYSGWHDWGADKEAPVEQKASL